MLAGVLTHDVDPSRRAAPTGPHGDGALGMVDDATDYRYQRALQCAGVSAYREPRHLDVDYPAVEQWRELVEHGPNLLEEIDHCNSPYGAVRRCEPSDARPRLNNGSMRILVFTAKFPPVIGGVEVFLGNLLPAMAAAGHEVEVVTSAFEGAPAIEEVDHVIVRRLPLEGALLSRDLRAALLSRRAVAELRDSFRPDVIHVHDPGAATGLHLRTRDANPRPVVLTVHTTLRHVGSRATRSFGVMLRHADRLVAVSDAVRRELTSLAPERSHDIDVIRPAVPLPAPPSPVPLDPVCLLMVGRLTHQRVSTWACGLSPRSPRHDVTSISKLWGAGPRRARSDTLRSSSASPTA
jgi:hypothetical protein